MKENLPKSGSGRGGRAPEPPRKSIIFPIIALAVVLAGGAATYVALKKPPPAPAPAPQAAIPPEPLPAIPSVPRATANSSVPARRNAAPAIPAPAPVPAAPADNRSPKELVASLTQIDGKTPVTPDQAEAWKQALRQLVRQGAAAVPGIQDFLAQNQNTNYAGLSGAGQLGYPSLRAGLIDALAQIGGAEANTAMIQILQSSTVPSDIADLAKALGQAATGQYQQEFLAAIRQQLFLAQQPQSSHDTDVGPLFQVLAVEAATGAPVAQDIQQYGSAWGFYSAITLANLPNGAGVPALAQMAQTPGGGQAVAMDFLAQMALTNPQALATLLDLVKSGSATDFVLATVAPFLGGRQFVLPSAADQIPAGAQVQSIHMSSGNQNFLSYQVSNPVLTNQQIAVIDQLLQVMPPGNTGALQALQQQKTTLSGQPAR